MAFVKTKPKLRAGRNVVDTVSMGVYLADGKKVDRKSVVFRFASTVLDKLGWQPTDEKPVLVNVFEGTDTDVGFLQLVPDAEGYSVTGKISQSSNQSRSISVGIDRFTHYVLNEPGSVPSAPVQYVVEGNTLLIECPDWLRFNPLSVEPKVTEIMAPQPTKDAAQHKTHVPRSETFEELMATTPVAPPPKPMPRLVATNASGGALPMNVRKGRKYVR
jgi:hypothetical protein